MMNYYAGHPAAAHAQGAVGQIGQAVLPTVSAVPDSGAGADKRERSSNWTHDETKTLIRSFLEHREELIRCTKKKTYVWEKIAKILVDTGFRRTGEQCKTRWQQLKKKYKEVLDHNNTPGNERMFWEHYDDFHKIFGNYPSGDGEMGGVDEGPPSPKQATTYLALTQAPMVPQVQQPQPTTVLFQQPPPLPRVELESVAAVGDKRKRDDPTPEDDIGKILQFLKQREEKEERLRDEAKRRREEERMERKIFQEKQLSILAAIAKSFERP